VASPDLAVAKDALNALLAAASFKFMTSIAGLGSSLVLSVAARSMTYLVESAAQRLADDLERAMVPIVTEGLAYDQLAATRAQLHQLNKIGAAVAAPAAPRAAPAGADAAQHEALQQILTSFLAEMRGSAGTELKQLATKLSGVGDAVGRMQSHIGHSGQQFADQLSLAASRLLTAATSLQDSLDGRVERVGARIDGLAATFARGEALFSAAAEKAAHGMLGGFEAFDASLRSQIGSMREIVASLDGARQALDTSAATWTHCAAPVVAAVGASREITAELGKVADRVGTAQRDMAQMAKAVAQLSERVGTVWDNYSTRFEKIDDELQAVFERLQGGTRAFGEDVMDFVGKLDTSLANGMQAFSLGTEELREVAQMLVVGNDAKAA
jgi:methyl-accepting chemotaxis protein